MTARDIDLKTNTERTLRTSGATRACSWQASVTFPPRCRGLPRPVLPPRGRGIPPGKKKRKILGNQAANLAGGRAGRRNSKAPWQPHGPGPGPAPPSPPPVVHRNGTGTRKPPRPRTAAGAYLRFGGSRCSAAGRRARPPPARTASGRAGTARKLRGAAAPGHRVRGLPASPRPLAPSPGRRHPGLPCRTCLWLMAAARPAARPRRAALLYPSPWQPGGSRAAERGGDAPTPPVTSARPPAAPRSTGLRFALPRAPRFRTRAVRQRGDVRGRGRDTAQEGCVRMAACRTRVLNV